MNVSKLPVLPLENVPMSYIQIFGRHYNTAGTLDYTSSTCTFCEYNKSCRFNGRVIINLPHKSITNFNQIKTDLNRFTTDNIYNLKYGIFSRRVCPYIKKKQEEAEKFTDTFLVYPGKIIVSPYLDKPYLYDTYKQEI